MTDPAPGLPPLLYLPCPTCQALTPTAWSRTPEPGDQMIHGCCAPCGTVIVTAAGDAETGLDGRTRHHSCGAVIRHPAAVAIIRCTTRGPGSITDTGCGALLPTTPST